MKTPDSAKPVMVKQGGTFYQTTKVNYNMPKVPKVPPMPRSGKKAK
jgi:hypothetical protein